jgi:hypothetical protein
MTFSMDRTSLIFATTISPKWEDYKMAILSIIVAITGMMAIVMALAA